MNNEIKEILDNLKKTADNTIFVVAVNQEELDRFPKSVCKYLSINNRQAKILLDYITNLQTIEQQYSAILSENAELENKITNLQEEVKSANESITWWNNRYNALQEENKEFYKKWKHTNVIIRNNKELVMNENTYDYLTDKEEIIDKAIEYIKGWQSFPHTNGSTHNELRNLLNILEGSDDNE